MDPDPHHWLNQNPVVTGELKPASSGLKGEYESYPPSDSTGFKLALTLVRDLWIRLLIRLSNCIQIISSLTPIRIPMGSIGFPSRAFSSEALDSCQELSLWKHWIPVKGCLFGSIGFLSRAVSLEALDSCQELSLWKHWIPVKSCLFESIGFLSRAVSLEALDSCQELSLWKHWIPVKSCLFGSVGFLSRAVSLETLDSCQELSLVSELKQKKLEYSQFFVSPFLQDEASELQFISLLNKVAAWPEVIFTIVWFSFFCW